MRRGVRSEKIRVIYNIIERARMDLNPLEATKTRMASPRRPFRFANVGQFVPWKRQTRFLDAASLVCRGLPECQFLLVGDDLFGRNRQYKQQLLLAARRSPAAGKIRFTGWLENMEAFWPQIDCLVHTADDEPFGRVVAEAMAHRIPVVAVRSGGPAELIEDDVTGLLVPGDDASVLASAMLRVTQERGLAQRLAAAAHDRANQMFASDSALQQLLAVYKDVLAA